MKVYISLPMGGKENTVRQRYDDAVAELKTLCGSRLWPLEIHGPVNIECFTDKGLSVPCDHDWAWYMGRDLEELLRCDTIFMTEGYLLSPGCRTELAVARERDMLVLYSEKARQNLKSVIE